MNGANVPGNKTRDRSGGLFLFTGATLSGTDPERLIAQSILRARVPERYSGGT